MAFKKLNCAQLPDIDYSIILEVKLSIQGTKCPE